MATTAPETQIQHLEELPSASTFALANVPLFRQMAAQYDFGDELARFEQTLVKTVFPSDKVVTRSQLLMFLSVAKIYKLNPFVREIFAFPAQDGGIVPVVSVDGWIQIIERQPQYDGVEFEYAWAAGKEGKEPVSCTAIIHRKDRQRPTKIEEYLSECVRDTKQWKQKPIRMLRHKALIQAARYAFGIAGIYDEDEAERILEGNLHTSSQGNIVSEIRMPQRVAEIAPIIVPALTPVTGSDTQLITVSDVAVPNIVTPVKVDPIVEPPEEVATPATEPEPVRQSDSDKTGNPIFQQLMEEGKIKPASEVPPPVHESAPKIIGKGRAQRLYTILNRYKIHTEQELKENFLAPLKLDHVSDMPVDIYEGVCLWAEGRSPSPENATDSDTERDEGNDGLSHDATVE